VTRNEIRDTRYEIRDTRYEIRGTRYERAFVNRLLLGLALVVTPLVGQQPRSFEPIDSGKVIRFQASGVVARGRLLAPLAVSSDSVVYCRFPGPPCLPPIEARQVGHLRLASLDHLDVQVGNHARKGAWIGGAVGTIFTFLAVAAQGLCEYDCLSDTELAFRAAISVATWSGIGALIGSGSPRMQRVF
jgi:hypothetical protein